MSVRFVPAAGERIVFQSERGGANPWSPWAGIGAVFVGVYVVGAVIAVVVGIAVEGVSALKSGLAAPALMVLGSLVLAMLWVVHKRGPAYFVSDRRILARRFLRSPLVLRPEDVVGARRILVQYTRDGGVVSQIVTHRVGVVLRSGSVERIGPVAQADEFVALLQDIGAGSVELRALSGVTGEPSRAEEREDLFFALKARTADIKRGPVFVGPTSVVGFANPFVGSHRNRILTIVGAERSAADVEQSVLALANGHEFGRDRAVVMQRDGASLRVEGASLVLGSDAGRTAFDLDAADAERARRYAKTGAHAYRS